MSLDPTRIDIGVDPLRARLSGQTAHGGMTFDVPYMSKIAPDLWQGGCANNLVLPTDIRHVVSLYPWQHYEVNHELDTSLTVLMYDSAQQGTEQVRALGAWVNSCRMTGPVLVHCQAGLNRSSLIVATALMLDGMSADDAIALIREKRSPACLCNRAFENWLRSHPTE